MSSARERALDSIKVGDVIFAVAAGGQEKLMLVYEADQDSILARHVTSQTRVAFGRDGESRQVPDGGTCTITSVASLPPRDYEVVIGLDHKMRTAKELTDLRLSKDEVDLLLRHVAFFKAHPLPDDDKR